MVVFGKMTYSKKEIPDVVSKKQFVLEEFLADRKLMRRRRKRGMDCSKRPLHCS